MYKKTNLIAAVSLLALVGCSDSAEAPPPPELPGVSLSDLLGNVGGNAGPSLNVNGALWRAALDTLDFLPLVSTDPFGGTIATDWGLVPGNTSERFRVNVLINSEELTPSALNLTLFRQVAQGNGWADAPVSAETVREVEDAILLRAREIRRAEAAANG